MNASWPALFALSTSETPRPRRRKKGYRPKRQNSLREIMPGPSKSQEQGTVYIGHARLRPFDARLRIITFWVLSGACHAAHTSASQRHPRTRVSSPSISHFTSPAWNKIALRQLFRLASPSRMRLACPTHRQQCTIRPAFLNRARPSNWATKTLRL